MRPTPTEKDSLAYLVAGYVQSGGEIKSLPAGNALKHDDGENWQQVNRKTYLIRTDKGELQ